MASFDWTLIAVIIAVVAIPQFADALRCKCTKESETVTCTEGVCETDVGSCLMLDHPTMGVHYTCHTRGLKDGNCHNRTSKSGLSVRICGCTAPDFCNYSMWPDKKPHHKHHHHHQKHHNTEEPHNEQINSSSTKLAIISIITALGGLCLRFPLQTPFSVLIKERLGGGNQATILRLELMALTLTYFDIRGIGEYIRLLFIDHGIEFVDHRIKKDDDWPKLKETMAFGQVPRLKHGDKEIFQSGAILRHLGRVYGLNGSNEDETTFIDMFFEGVKDIRFTKYARYIYYDEYTREETINTVLPTELEKLEKLFKTYANGDHFIAGEKVSYADYALFEELDVYLTLDAHILDKFPKLKAFHERFSQRPNLKAHLAKRVEDKVWINGIEKQ
ncbi:unnamed protein product [Caenorhabditis bovis]|uniref:glutathione transferase n=1 Tax=Caenorhabditis bovis TaxID=2654633 RepID=A0A8S1ER61_9PELO|nr:unnamed protein product [Caenorhabditis bovis]